jgi:putative membrane protein
MTMFLFGLHPEETTMITRIKRAAAYVAAVVCVAGFQPLAHAQSSTPPTDPQIVGIVINANQIDIDYAKLALKKAKDKQVRAFAQQMVTDHSAVLKSVQDLGAKLHVTPAESDTSRALKSQSAETTHQLKALKGKAFDKAYIDNEVAYHKAVIDAVSNVLIPNAQNAELKSALQGAAPLFQGPLEHAEKIQAALEGNAGASSHSDSH